jgi:hypothetical protein
MNQRTQVRSFDEKTTGLKAYAGVPLTLKDPKFSRSF